MATYNPTQLARDVAAESASTVGNYFRPGFIGTCEVVGIKIRAKCGKPPQADRHFIEFKVLDGNGVHENGAIVSISENVDAANPWRKDALKRIKGYLLTIADVAESEVTQEEFFEEFLASANEDPKAVDGKGNPRAVNPRAGSRVRIE